MIFAQLLVSGLLIGSVYALISIGLSLTFGVMRLVNFMHGDFLMLSMYLTYWAFTWFRIPPYASLGVVVPLLTIVGAVVYYAIIRFAIRKSHETSILVTIGLSVVSQNLALVWWAADYRSVHTELTSAVAQIGTLRISQPMLIAFLVTIAASVCLYLFLQYTYLGKAIRAASADPFAARLMGIRPQRIFSVSFGIGVALVGIAGVLLSPVYAVYPTVGEQFSLIAFVVVVLGGLGSLKGAFLGGLLIGVVETFSSYYIAPSMKQLVYLFLFIAILIAKPGGLFGNRASGAGSAA